MAISKDFLWGTIETLVADLERADPQSIVAARTRGLLDAKALSLHSTDRHSPKRHYRAHDDEIGRLYLGGMSTWAVAKELGMNASTVGAALRRKGVTIRSREEGAKVARQTRDEPRVKLIREWRAEGKTLEEIAAELHITRERVRQIMIKNGIDAERQLTPDQKQAVAEYVSGESLETVAARHKSNPSTLRGWITKEGFAIRPSPRTSKRDPETLARSKIAAEMYENGKPIREISEALGYGHEVGGIVYRLLAIAGVKPDRGSFNTNKRQQVSA